MLRHAFLLIWQRKGANALLIVELVVTFLVLFTLAGFSLNFYRLYQQPLGFNVDDIWSVRISTGAALTDTDRSTFRQLLRTVEQMPEVASVDAMLDPVFFVGGSGTNVTIEGQFIDLEVNAVSAGFPEAVGMTLLRGRWFGPEDEAQGDDAGSIAPILVNQAFVDAAGQDVLGMIVPFGERQQRVIGVFEDFRQHGQFVGSKPFVMQRLNPEGQFTRPPLLVIVTKPGAGIGFEERLLNVLLRTAPTWDFDANSWITLQQAHLRNYVIPLLIAGCLVVFLLALVGFGLLGVLWQNVIRRTPEMGLRRALGAPASAVRMQVVLEMVVLASLALLLGWLIVVQLPLAGVIRQLDWALFIPSMLISTAALLALCILFALYPGWQATSKEPVEALRYE